MDELTTLPVSRSTKRAIKKRSILLYQGEIPRQAYIVKKGVIKIYRLSRSGDEQIVGFCTAGDLFPEAWVFGKTSSALYYYEALEDSEVTTVERSVLLDHIDNNAELRQNLLDYFINSHTSHLLQITALEQSRAADKLLLMLHYLTYRYATETKPGDFELKFHLTHTLLGNLTGLTRETTSVELGRLRRKGVISYSGARFTIHRKALEQHLVKESFSDVQLDLT